MPLGGPMPIGRHRDLIDQNSIYRKCLLPCLTL